MTLPKLSGFNFHDHAADPSAEGEIQRNAEEIKAYLEGAVQKLVMLRYPGVNPGLNLLRNPSFEVDADGTTPPTGWANDHTGGEVDDADKYEGAKSALITADTDPSSGLSQTVAVKKGQYIRASVACKATTASHGHLFVHVDGAFQISEFHSGGGAWEVLSDSYGPVTADGDVKVYIRKAIVGATTDVWFDQAVLEVLDIAPPEPAATRYVVRDATAADFEIDDFTCDGAWNVDALDLSSIVPAGAIAVDLLIKVFDIGAAASRFTLRRDATNDYNRIYLRPPVANQRLELTQRIAINSNRLLDYFISPNYSEVAGDEIEVTVLGWVLAP